MATTTNPTNRLFIFRAQSWLILLCCLVSTPSCQRQDPPDNILIIGMRGVDNGHFSKPRAIEIDSNDQVYIVDMTGRIQVFDRDGQFLRDWRTPEIKNGKPCGLGIAKDGSILVADTHYFRILFYSPNGDLLPRSIGGTNGRNPGEFGFVTDVVEDPNGNIYVSEYGDFDRIQKFDSAGNFVLQWGGHGTESGKFLRPQALAIDKDNLVWVADACNHRIQVFDASQAPVKLVMSWGHQGSKTGELMYPYGIWLADDETVFVSEFGNHRIQRFTRDGTSLGCFGSAGRGPGQFHQPWSLALDSHENIFILDSYNHRVQRIPISQLRQ